MADGTKVGNVYLDLVVRDTIVQQVQDLASKAQAAARRQFSDIGKAVGDAMTQGMADASRAMTNTVQQSAADSQKAMTGMVNGVFSKSVALMQAKLNSLQKTFDANEVRLEKIVQDTARGFAGSPWADQATESALNADKTYQALQRQQEKLENQMAYLREKLAIEVQAQAQKQAAAEQAAYAKAAKAAEDAAKRQLAAARQAHTATAPPAASRKINTANAVRSPQVADQQEQAADSAEKCADRQAAAKKELCKTQSQPCPQTKSNNKQCPILKSSKALTTLGNKAKSIFGKISGFASKMAKQMTPFNAQLTRAGAGVQGMAARLKSIVAGALVFNVLSAGLSQVTNYIGTALTGTSQMQAALANLKGAAATAAAPIIQILTPALAALANAAATVFSYLSQLISFFTGKSVSAMASAAKGMSGVGSAAGGAAKEVKKANGELAAFDELNVLNKQQDEEPDASGGGGGTGAIVPNYDFKGKNPFLDSILDAIKAGQWEEVGKLLAEKLNGAMASIPWDKIDKTVSGWVSNLARTLNGFVSALDWPLLGKTVASGLNVGLHAVDTFMDTFDFTALGDGLANGLNGAIAALDWASLGRFLTDKFRAVFETLHGFVRSFDFVALGESLATATTAAINNVDWVQAFGDGSAFIVGALQALTAWVQGIDWASLGTTIADCFLAIDWSGILLNLVLFIGTTLSSLGEMAASFFTELAHSCGDGFLGGILEFVAGIFDWIRINFVDPIVNSVKDLLGIHSPSTVFAEIGTNLVLGLLNGLTQTWVQITAFFTSALSAIQSAVTSAWTAISDMTAGIWNGITETIRGAVNSIISIVNGMIQAVVSGINAVIDVINGFSIDVPKFAQGALGTSKIGFDIARITAPQIPMLASGGVIRQPTLAMMGEYPGAASDPEIAAPQSVIARAVSDANGDVVDAVLTAAQQIIQAIRENGGEIVIGDEVIGRAARRYNDRRAVMTGGVV